MRIIALSLDKIKLIRAEKIRARNAISPYERQEFSKDICHNILCLPEYAKSRYIMIYKWIDGEVRLDELEMKASLDGKVLLFPVTFAGGKMIAIHPGSGPDAWNKGRFGISEPVAEKGRIINPGDIDLVVCPCTAFDDNMNRVGMGGGYYDRFLPDCTNACVLAVAFEVQRCESLPHEIHDFLMSAIVTEKNITRKSETQK